jgi:hypothetical protein
MSGVRSERTSCHFDQVASPKRVIRASPWRRERATGASD